MQVADVEVEVFSPVHEAHVATQSVRAVRGSARGNVIRGNRFRQWRDPPEGTKTKNTGFPVFCPVLGIFFKNMPN